ncbi:MAG: response regulator [Saprospiraceae bacterium]
MNTKNKTPILLIEDNPGDVTILKVYLEDAGLKYSLYHKDSLYDGLELIQQVPIEVVLLDLNLPDSTGFKTVTTFLEKAPQIPVIVLTGTNNEIIGNQSVKAGAQDFIVKGQFDGKLLGRIIRYALQRSKVQLRLEESAKDLEASKRWFLEAMEMARFGTWEMDLVSNEMKWTDEVYRIFNFLPGGISPTLSTYLEYVHPEDYTEVEDFFEAATKDAALHQMEHRILVDTTTLRHVALHAKVQVAGAGGKIMLVGGIQDITERKLSEKLLLEKNISSKTAMIQEEALSELSFYIRTPLSSVVNLLHLLENTPVSSQQKSHIDDLKTSVDDLSIAVNNLLNFTVMVSGSVKVEEEQFHLRTIMQGLRNVVQLKADAARLSLHFDVEETLPQKLVSDPKKLTQIFYNLIDNAIKFTPEGGKITVGVAKGKEQGNKLEIELSVSDTGVGMPAEKVQELLKADVDVNVPPPTEDNAKKRPLGMAIVGKLVKTLGGQLAIDSHEGEGSTFKVTLTTKVVREAGFVAGDAPEAPLKILLVEDHFLNQIATKKILTSWSGYVSVDIAENGSVALEKFAAQNYDLVLMDIQMPVMDGLEAAGKIRKISHVPIIALTANASIKEQDKCFEIGMNDYLAKPFKPEELYAKIMNIMSLVLN